MDVGDHLAEVEVAVRIVRLAARGRGSPRTGSPGWCGRARSCRRPAARRSRRRSRVASRVASCSGVVEHAPLLRGEEELLGVGGQLGETPRAHSRRPPALPSASVASRRRNSAGQLAAGSEPRRRGAVSCGARAACRAEAGSSAAIAATVAAARERRQVTRARRRRSRRLTAAGGEVAEAGEAVQHGLERRAAH